MTQDSQGPTTGAEGQFASEPPSQGDLSGRMIAGKYSLVRLLGQGGMGAVYEARNEATLKRVAVKLLFDEFGSNDQVVKRFFREAQASSVIESDYIVQVYDSGRDEETTFPYMVMEMLQGEDLEELLERLGPLHPLAVGKIMLQASMGLAKAHERGIVHRDIKPANIYLTTREDGDVVAKLLDFGVAKVRMEQFSDQTSSGLTATGSVLGTPLYMSPEQARGLPDVDARSDVWSMGVVMYEMLAGTLPYDQARTLGDLMVAIITAELPLLQDHAPWVPPELAEVAHRAMSRDPNIRYQDASQLRDALASIISDGPRFNSQQLVALDEQYRSMVAPRLQLEDGMLKAVTKTGLSMTTPPKKQPKKSNAGLVVGALAGGALLIGGGGFAAYQLTKGGSEDPAPEPPPSAVVEAPPPKEPEKPPEGEKELSFVLVVLPSDAEAYVDEKKSKVISGTLKINGRSGTTRTVRIVKEGKEAEAIIAITENGLLPPKIELKLDDKGPKRPGQIIGRPARPPKPAGDKPPAPKPVSPLATDTDEFK